MAGLKRGDDTAFETLVRQTSAQLLAVARRFATGEEDAQDIVQTAYLNVFRAIERFEGRARLSTWLHRIVVTTALMRLRSDRSRLAESLEPLLPSFRSDSHHRERFQDGTTPADVLLEQAETRAVVRRCIAQLPPRSRTVLMLRHIEERSTRDVAEALDLTPATVKTRLHRARQALATLLRQQFAGRVTSAGRDASH